MLEPRAISNRASEPTTLHTVIIGGGPVGMRAAQRLSAAGMAVTVLSAETFAPYNRVRLTPLLAGDVQFGDILSPTLPSGDFSVITGVRATEIDREQSCVITADGRKWPYETLIIATGSRAFVPGVPGFDLGNVFTFRTAEDAQALMARSFSARRVAVVGGGLLGLEAARGMQRRGAEVTVLEHEGRVMPRQLDQAGGDLLAARIRDLGVEVITGVAVREAIGARQVEGLILADGRTIACDTVILCTGVRANNDLAIGAGLPINRAIVVNDNMQTADPHIYAIGECAEHNGHVHGLVGPGYEQADAAVAHILTPMGQAGYTGSIPATKLKVLGAEVLSVGAIEQLEVRQGVSSHVYEDADGYRRIFIENGRLVGVTAVGKWAQAGKVQNAVQTDARVYPWMIYRFRRDGILWPEVDEAAADMPDSATVCNCTGVTCGRLRQAAREGANTPERLSLATGAGTVCGTCRPMLEEFTDAKGGFSAARYWKPLLALSAMAMCAALVLALVPRVPFPSGFQADNWREWLWRDNIVKQWTGYTLLGITVVAMVLGLRKRWRFTDRLGSYDIWRLIHIGVGLLAAVGLFVHTGLRPGANLNLWLFLSFVATLIFGALAGLATGGDHKLREHHIGTAKKPARRLPVWGHIIAVWPLPALLMVHVLVVYVY